LDLLRPIYRSTAAYGHFGREGLPWEDVVPTVESEKTADEAVVEPEIFSAPTKPAFLPPHQPPNSVFVATPDVVTAQKLL